MGVTVIDHVLRLALAAVFIWAGASKAMDPGGFVFAVHAFRLTPWPVSAGIALYLPWLEILAGSAILFRRTRPGGLAVLLVLALVFLGVLLSAAARGLPISCGCFGAGMHSRGLGGSIALDLVLLPVILYLILRHVADIESPVHVRQNILFR